MTLGFSVDGLLPKARGGGQLKMGLVRLNETEWLQPEPDLSAREAGFAAHSEGIQLSEKGTAAGEELAAMLGVSGGLPGAAKAHHEDMCLLSRSPAEEIYRLVGAAVAWPTDWHPKDKMGLPLASMHAPIQGYREQLASGVDHFMAKLKPGKIFGRCNWFVAPTHEMRWIAGDPAVEFADVNADNAGEKLFIRSERQTLCRLPDTGAILFTIGVYVSPLKGLLRKNVARLAASFSTLLDGEGDRRSARYFADALTGYNDRLERASPCST